MKPMYISLPRVWFWLSRIGIVAAVSLLERPLGGPLLTVFVILLLAQNLDSWPRSAWLLGWGAVLAILYLLPFWVMIGLLFVAQFLSELVLHSWLKRELVMASLSLMFVICVNIVFQREGQALLTAQTVVLALIVLGLYQVQTRVGLKLGSSSWLQWYEKHRD